MDSHAELGEKFRQFGIDTSCPGFYDDPKFIAAQAGNPTLLEDYAEFVLTRPCDAAYLSRARQVTADMAEFLYGKLVADGRLGACIDCSGGMLRMLERKGIWCYMATGGLRLEFVAETGIPTLRFHPFMPENSPAVAAHGWLSAPPFHIVDIAISRQPVDARANKFLPRYVLAETVRPGTYDRLELIEPDYLQSTMAIAGWPPTVEEMNASIPDFQLVAAKFGVVDVPYEQVTLTYIPCYITVPDNPLEGIRSLCLSGKFPGDLYQEYQSTRVRTAKAFMAHNPYSHHEVLEVFIETVEELHPSVGSTEAHKVRQERDNGRLNCRRPAFCVNPP